MSGKCAVILSAMVFQLLGASASNAGEASRLPRIGILIPESGYKEKENILVEIRDAKGDRAALKPMANELVGKKVDLIFTTGTRSTGEAMAATSEVPIVFRHPGDPQAMGLVQSNTRPGRNVTGVAGFGMETTGKRLEALKQIVPEVRRLHIFYDLNDKSSRESFAFAKKSAELLG